MIQSVSRAFTVLKTVATHPSGIGVTDIARQMNVHKSTVSRLISTLEDEKAIERLPDGSFRIGTGILELVPHHNAHEQLAALMQPYLMTLAKATGEAVGLSVPDGDSSLTLVQMQSQHAIQVQDWTQVRFPLHVSSSGKHFLAWSSADFLASYMMRPLARYTRHTLTDGNELRERLNEVRIKGIDWTFDEFEDGLAAASVPLRGTNGIIGTVYLSGPSFRFPGKNKDKFSQLLLKICDEASDKLTRTRFDHASSILTLAHV